MLSTTDVKWYHNCLGQCKCGANIGFDKTAPAMNYSDYRPLASVGGALYTILESRQFP